MYYFLPWEVAEFFIGSAAPVFEAPPSTLMIVIMIILMITMIIIMIIDKCMKVKEHAGKSRHVEKTKHGTTNQIEEPPSEIVVYLLL